MRPGSQVTAIIEQALNSALFALEAVIVSVYEGRATVRPTPKRLFGDNPDPVAYPIVENVRLLSLVWDGGKSGISGRVLPGDECLLIALSHGDGDEPDHKTLSNSVALCGFSDKAIHQIPDSPGIRIFSGSAFIEWDDGSIKGDTGQGATFAFTGNKMTVNAPGGIDMTAPMTTINGNLKISGSIIQGAKGGGNAEFGGNVKVTGISEAADHISSGKSGKSHKHRENGQGNLSDEPT
ncbi:phage baseplate protein [Salmonella enterica subsp. enterica serovar Newport]|nr:phage baseplate protein [Salmonella enterica subsp. enterica serovar Newport]EBR7919157.1 phage baseplate protein [Salmonella enterica subsp. enterica serovar Newport]EBS3271217.1 phage baseplate protein [Salmonella enterica subsp. enterica serovar Newport]EBU6786742.1 phage baseplate protein [Salmonella enterica subsp. enterica serovar Newport]EBU9266627.1 phage baseplate protein [Salmonella enterica subsp. enterica serovar Newport]